VVDIFIGTSKTLALKEAVADAVESGHFGSLADDIRDCFSDEQVEQIEELIDSGDIDEFIETVLSDWSGDAPEDLLEEIKEGLAESDITLSFDEEQEASEEVAAFSEETFDEEDEFAGGDDEEEEDDEDEDEDEDEDDEDDEDDEEYDEDEEDD